MGKVRLKKSSLVGHFIRDWRKHRGLTQEKLAERVGVSTGAISQLERGDVGYTQPMLEALSEELRCEPSDLITYSPKAVKDLREIWASIPQENREQAMKMLRALSKTGTDG